MPARTLVILNPASRSGAAGRRFRGVEAKLRKALGPLDVELTRGPRDAERIAREGVRAGVERLVVAGGDGTLSETVSGLLSAGLGDYATVGLLPLGTGGDFARTLGIPHDVDEAIACIEAGAVRRADAARVTTRDDTGRPATVHCANVASFGISGLTVELVNRAPKALGGRASFMIGTVRGIFAYECQAVTLRVDGRVVHDGGLVLAAVANGEYFGGGMRVAPEARPDDGLLDVVTVAEMGRPTLLRKFPMIYRGEHLGDPACERTRGRVVEAEAPPGRVLVEVDGESMGSLPARIEVVPDAVSYIGLPA